MSGNGAYEDEMNVALFENALRAAVPTRPDPRLAANLVPRMAAMARAATLEAETHPLRPRTVVRRSRFALVARVGIAVALIPLVLAGLAFAGVTVPSPARSAFESVGISLPNQPSSDNEGTSSKNRSGKATGNDVSNSDKPEAGSKGRSEAAHKHALKQHEKAQGKALGHEKGKAIGLNGSTPPGQTQSHGPPAHSNAGGGGHASTTHTTPTPPTPPIPTTPGNSDGHGK
jgi:hypothetical protein